MFTFRKFAAISVAALTALSISSCSDDTEDPEPGQVTNLVKKNFTLSFSGKSYGDIDAPASYGQADAITHAEDIDVVAYYTSDATDKVKNPCYVPTIGEDCGFPEFYEIPSKYWSSLASGSTTADIKDFLTAFSNDEIDVDEVDEISISKGSAFLVYTTSSKYFVVVIKDNAAQSVSLEFSKTGLE